MEGGRGVIELICQSLPIVAPEQAVQASPFASQSNLKVALTSLPFVATTLMALPAREALQLSASHLLERAMAWEGW